MEHTSTRSGTRGATGTPENLVRWFEDPRAVEPGTAMPNRGLADARARDGAAHLYTLR